MLTILAQISIGLALAAAFVAILFGLAWVGITLGPADNPMAGHQKGVIYDCICGQCQEHNERLMNPTDYERYRREWEVNGDHSALYLMTKAMEDGKDGT